MLDDIRLLQVETEYQLATTALAWWNAQEDQTDRPEFVKLAQECSKYPGKYWTITLVPGWLCRLFTSTLFYVACIAAGP
jgi:hypothetical protein